jgi:hypothetical protein
MGGACLPQKFNPRTNYATSQMVFLLAKVVTWTNTGSGLLWRWTMPAKFGEWLSEMVTSDRTLYSPNVPLYDI